MEPALQFLTCFFYWCIEEVAKSTLLWLPGPMAYMLKSLANKIAIICWLWGGVVFLRHGLSVCSTGCPGILSVVDLDGLELSETNPAHLLVSKAD